MDNRDRVIEYVAQKYGRDRVGQIITYATMAARGVIRDVARVMGHGYGFADSIAKLVPGTPGATLVDALEQLPGLKQRYDNEEDTRAVIDLDRKSTRLNSTHQCASRMPSSAWRKKT